MPLQTGGGDKSWARITCRDGGRNSGHGGKYEIPLWCGSQCLSKFRRGVRAHVKPLPSACFPLTSSLGPEDPDSGSAIVRGIIAVFNYTGLFIHLQNAGTHQVPHGAGDPNANWAYFQEQKQAHINLRLRLSTGLMTDFQEPGTNTGSVFEAKFPKLGPSKIVKNTRIGKASDFWNLYEKDIKLAADLGRSHSIFLSSGTLLLSPWHGQNDKPLHIFDLLQGRAWVIQQGDRSKVPRLTQNIKETARRCCGLQGATLSACP